MRTDYRPDAYHSIVAGRQNEGIVAAEVACLHFLAGLIVPPRPSQVLTTFAVQMQVLRTNILQTLFTRMVGFAGRMTIGVLLGVFVGVSRTAYNTAYPLLVGFSPIPRSRSCQYSCCGSAQEPSRPSSQQ